MEIEFNSPEAGHQFLERAHNRYIMALREAEQEKRTEAKLKQKRKESKGDSNGNI